MEAGGAAPSVFGGGSPAERDVAACLNAKGGTGRSDFDTENLVVYPIDMRQASRGETMTNNRRPGTSGGAPGTGNGGVTGGVPFVLQDGTGRDKSQGGAGVPHAGPAYTVDTQGVQAVCCVGGEGVRHALTARHDSGEDGTGRGTPIVTDGYLVRRLTPRECERLMGWPDDHTRWRADGTELKDGPRYRLCGNGVVGTVARWLAVRLMGAMRGEGGGA